MPVSATQQKTTEDYLKTIYLLSETECPVTTSRIAVARDVRPASVSSMLKKLAKLGLVSYKKRHGVTLTDAGRAIALEMIRHHRLLELYLTEVLGFGWHEVHDEAEALEHVISEKFVKRIAEALDNPTCDPHGSPIPQKDGTLPPEKSRALLALEEGDAVVVARIDDDTNKELLCYLADLGLVPGARLTILEIAPFDGPIIAQVEGRRQVIGYRAAQAIYVT